MQDVRFTLKEIINVYVLIFLFKVLYYSYLLRKLSNISKTFISMSMAVALEKLLRTLPLRKVKIKL